MKEQERKKKCHCAIFLPPITEAQEGFSCSWRAYLNWIFCWLKWIGPILQLLITRSWGQMGESSERTLSLILRPLMCCGILGCRKEKKEDGRDGWPFGPSDAHTVIRTPTVTHMYIHTFRDPENFMVERRMRSKTTERCRAECFLSFTSHPAVGVAGCWCQRSACQTWLPKHSSDPFPTLAGSHFNKNFKGCNFSAFSGIQCQWKSFLNV